MGTGEAGKTLGQGRVVLALEGDSGALGKTHGWSLNTGEADVVVGKQEDTLG